VHAGSAARLEQSYRDIANQVELPGRSETQANIFELVRNWLRDEKNGEWLLVLDNADDSAVLDSLPGRDQHHLSRYLPPSKHGSVVVTSRSVSVASYLVEEQDIFRVKPMHFTDAQNLLQKKLMGDVATEGVPVNELAVALEYMPLALVQAAAYISKRGPHYSVQQYLEEFRKNDKRKVSLLNQGAGHLRRNEEANNSIIITWQISFEHIWRTRQSAANILSLMSFFDRQGIPKALLLDSNVSQSAPGDVWAEDGEESDQDEGDNDEDDSSSNCSTDDSFIDDILTLRDYSFVSETTDPETLEMHSLVQLATQKWLEGRGEVEGWRQRFISTLCSAFPKGRHESWDTCRSLFPHAIAALTKRPRDEGSRKEWAELMYNAARYAWQRGDIHEAESLAIASMEARRMLLGAESDGTLNSMAMVGLVYNLAGRWEAAEELEIQVLETSRRRFGADHPDTLTSMANLASTYRHQGRWEAAEELEVQVMDTRKTKLGADHHSTLTSMTNLASTYRKQGRWEAAEELEVQVLENRKTKLGGDHLDTQTSMADLASTYRYQGRWEIAEELFVQVMDTRKTKLGADHPSTLTSMANLALTYQDQEQWVAAEELLVQVVETCKTKLGADHPSTLASINNLASTYQYQGRWEIAEELFVQVMDTRKTKLGADHPSTLTSMANLALTYQNQGRRVAAEELLVQVIKTSKTKLGADHPETLKCINSLASTYYSQGRWKAAEELFVQVIETRKTKLGADHPSTLTSINNLAWTWKAQNRDVEAIALMRQCVQLLLRKLGAAHPHTRASVATLSSWESQ
jgi:tetratricopeptide (TPR) repeat protein